MADDIKLTFSIDPSIRLKMPKETEAYILEKLSDALSNKISEEVVKDLQDLKKYAREFLTSLKVLQNNYQNFNHQNIYNLLQNVTPEAAAYAQKNQQKMEREYFQAAYILADRFQAALDKFREVNQERKGLYVFEDIKDKNVVNTNEKVYTIDSYEMDFKEVIVNAYENRKIGEISKKRLTTNGRKSLESTDGLFEKDHLEEAKLIYNYVRRRYDRYFEVYGTKEVKYDKNGKALPSGGNKNAMLMWKEDKDWILANVTNMGDIKEAYASFLFSEHGSDLCKLLEGETLDSNDGYGPHEAVSVFYKKYIGGVGNMAAIVEEDVITGDKQFAVKGSKAELPKFNQYVQAANMILLDKDNELNKSNIKTRLKEAVKNSVEAKHNIAKNIGQVEVRLLDLTKEELRKLYEEGTRVT